MKDFLDDGRPCNADGEHIAPCLECSFGANRRQPDSLCLSHLRLAFPMTKKDEREQNVLRALCDIGATVGKHHRHEYAYDCFCTSRDEKTTLRFQYEETILDFIRTAVAEKIAREGAPPSRYE